MVGKSYRPSVEILEDDGWLTIVFRQGCNRTDIEVPDDKNLMRKIITILQERIDS